jgi:ethanolamine utilization protein EutA (predicted chaperonin)
MPTPETNEVKIDELDKNLTECKADKKGLIDELFKQIKEERKERESKLEGVEKKMSDILTEIQKQRTKFYAFWLTAAGVLLTAMGGIIVWFINYQFQVIMEKLKIIIP